MRRPFIAALGGLAFAFAATALPGVPQTPVTLRIASTPIDVGAEVYYAKDKGFFRDAGIDVQIQSIDNGAAIASAVAGGAVDIGQSNVVSIAAAHEKQLPFVVIAPAGTYSASSPTTVLVTLADAPYHGAKDLEGKTLVTNGILNIAQIGGDAWLDQQGANWRSAHWVEIPTTATAAALIAHRVDAAMMSEPSLGAALAQGGFRVMAHPYDALGSRWQIGAWFTTKTWAAAHPELVRKFRDVMRRTAIWANAHHAESLQILSAESKHAYPSDMQRSTYVPTIDPLLFQPVIDAAARYGAISAPFPANELFGDLR